MTRYVVETNENVPLYLGEFNVSLPPKYGKVVNGVYYPDTNYFNIYHNTTRSLTGAWINNCPGFCPDVVETDASRYEITVHGVRTPMLDLLNAQTEVYLTGRRDYQFNIGLHDPDQAFENVTILIKPRIHANQRFDGPVPLDEFNNHVFRFDRSDTVKVEIYRPWPDCFIHTYEMNVHIISDPSISFESLVVAGIILLTFAVVILCSITVGGRAKKGTVSARKSSASTEISLPEL
jgi:hypothetical protein